jgi:hypothetical protein
MALSNNKRETSLHFWVRFAGLTGLVVLATGLVVVAVAGGVTGWALAVIGAVLAGVALLFEMQKAVALLLSRRGALGSNVAAQVLLAAILFAGINVFSFFHYARFDWTRDQEFTITADPTVDAAIREGLGKLRGETRIILYQRHTSFGQLTDRPDSYDAAAERKIVEKVKDLAEQFQELGSRFKIELLDSQDESFPGRLETLKKKAPKLAAAIEAAPENSIFFYADGQVQRLAFHDVYELDKQASQEANGGQGNLVLRYQGVGPFARRVLNIDEPRPRIAVGVIHEVLGLGNDDEIGMAGAKKALAARGIDGRDIILKKWGRRGMPEAAVLTPDEFKYERLDITLNQLDQALKTVTQKIDEYGKKKKEFASLPLAELNKRFTLVRTVLGAQLVDSATVNALEKQGRRLEKRPLTEAIRKDLLEQFDEALADMQQDRAEGEKRRAEVAREQSNLNVEGLAEQRRVGDLRDKFTRLLEGCDLLILPRWTLLNAARGNRIPNWLYRLDAGQVAAIKDYMKSGKPVLFCLGPPNEPPGEMPPGVDRADRVEDMLEDLGFKLPAQTILYNVESEALAEQQAGLLLGGPQVEVPPVLFDWKADRPMHELAALADMLTPVSQSAIRTSLALAARSVGKKGSLDLRLRNPRPVYYAPLPEAGPDSGTVFMRTNTACWNESKPFSSEDYTPKYERPKPDDPSRGTLREERHGPFPIAAAIETRVPASWYEGKQPATLPKVRVAVIGHGGVFGGPTLKPAQEKVLLDTCNWLMGRDDLLARNGRTWEYPRVALADTGIALWQWGTRLGLPLLFVYLGLVVLMVRRMR